ncbi:hypothetical protein ACO0LL_02280 [Undibacterium sp. TC4M20W]|uniref:hypothetical protein n=1 Tax=Undibacterium sp. TC4M20W TaxID=3413052 RepID=UPI003BF3AFBA
MFIGNALAGLTPESTINVHKTDPIGRDLATMFSVMLTPGVSDVDCKIAINVHKYRYMTASRMDNEEHSYSFEVLYIKGVKIQCHQLNT